MKLIVQVDVKTADAEEFLHNTRYIFPIDGLVRIDKAQRFAEQLQNLLEKSIKVVVERDADEP